MPLTHSSAIARTPWLRASATRPMRLSTSACPAWSGGRGKQPVHIKTRLLTRSGASRQTSNATRPPIECPTRAKRVGAASKICSAMRTRLSAWRGSATELTKNGSKAGQIGAHTVRSHISPGTQTTLGLFKPRAPEQVSPPVPSSARSIAAPMRPAPPARRWPRVASVLQPAGPGR